MRRASALSDCLISDRSAAGVAGRRSSAATRASMGSRSNSWAAAAQGSSGAIGGAQNGDAATPATVSTSIAATQTEACQNGRGAAGGGAVGFPSDDGAVAPSQSGFAAAEATAGG